MAFEKIKIQINPKKNRYLHSQEHVLADDLSRDMKEPKKFAAYLGIAKLYRESDLRALAKYILAKKNLALKNRGKYFFGALRRMPKKQGITFKISKRKKKNGKKNHTNSKRPVSGLKKRG